MGRTKATKAPYEGVLTIFKDSIYKILTQIKDKPYFKRPYKMVSDVIIQTFGVLTTGKMTI